MRDRARSSTPRAVLLGILVVIFPLLLSACGGIRNPLNPDNSVPKLVSTTTTSTDEIPTVIETTEPMASTIEGILLETNLLYALQGSLTGPVYFSGADGMDTSTMELGGHYRVTHTDIMESYPPQTRITEFVLLDGANGDWIAEAEINEAVNYVGMNTGILLVDSRAPEEQSLGFIPTSSEDPSNEDERETVFMPLEQLQSKRIDVKNILESQNMTNRDIEDMVIFVYGEDRQASIEAARLIKQAGLSITISLGDSQNYEGPLSSPHSDITYTEHSGYLLQANLFYALTSEDQGEALGLVQFSAEPDLFSPTVIGGQYRAEISNERAASDPLCVFIGETELLDSPNGDWVGELPMSFVSDYFSTLEAALLIDVRPTASYRESHIPTPDQTVAGITLNLPIDILRSDDMTIYDLIDAATDSENRIEERVILVYGETEEEAKEAALLIKEAGFPAVFSIGSINDYEGELFEGEEPVTDPTTATPTPEPTPATTTTTTRTPEPSPTPTTTTTTTTQTAAPTPSPTTVTTTTTTTTTPTTTTTTTTPEPTTPEPTTPEPAMPEPTTPEATTPDSTTPEPTTPQQTIPEPSTPEATTPDPTASEPTTPDPTTSEPTTSEPSTAAPTATFSPEPSATLTPSPRATLTPKPGQTPTPAPAPTVTPTPEPDETLDPSAPPTPDPSRASSP